MTGKKFDMGKPRYDLVPPDALEEFVKVLTFGAEKYGAENWREVEQWNERYFAAAQRHLWAYKRGQYHDKESGLHHLAHAMCCIAFMLDLDTGRGTRPNALIETYDVVEGYTRQPPYNDGY